MVNIDYINEWFRYEPETGKFFWKKLRPRMPAHRIGSRAGGVNHAGYWMLVINNKRVMAHRIVWLLETGEWTNGDIDHINGIPSDNRFANLRHVDHKTNMRNLRAHKDSKSGILGVRYHDSKKRWIARMVLDGVVQQKVCRTKEEAIYYRKKFEESSGFISR